MVSKWTTWDLVIATEQVEVQGRPWKTMFKGVASPMNTELKAAGSPGFFVWMITQHVSTSFPASLFILCCIFDRWIPATFTNFHLSNGPTKIDKLHLHSSMLAACFVGCMIGTTTSPRAVASQRKRLFTSTSSLCRLCRLLLVEICHIFSWDLWAGQEQFAPSKFGILWKTCDPKLHLLHVSVAPAKLLPHRTRGGSEPIAMKFCPWCLRSTCFPCFIQISKELYYMCYLWNRLKLMTL